MLKSNQEKAKDLIKTLDLRFTSGNSEPVERSTIKDHEWELLKKYIGFLEADHSECLRQLGSFRAG